jgi:hypothetical protein
MMATVRPGEADAVAGRVARLGAGTVVARPGLFGRLGAARVTVLSVVGALRRTTPGAVLVQALTEAPGLDGWALVERLLKDLAPLRDGIWLVVDDVHELGPEVLRQLELLLMRAPPGLRFVLSARCYQAHSCLRQVP